MGRENDRKIMFKASGKQISVYPSTAPNMPVIYLNTYSDESDKLFYSLQGMNCPDFSLVSINGLVWNHDMVPWDIPPVTKDDTPFTGGADDYLKLLTDEIIPRSEELIRGNALWRGIAGYSLAGLFAVYAVYQTELFSRVASISGSLWFPDFKEYVFSHKTKSFIKCIYFSLGDKECQTKNPYLKIVQKNTEEIASLFAKNNINTAFKLNKGNHYKAAVQRTISGIDWILNN